MKRTTKTRAVHKAESTKANSTPTRQKAMNMRTVLASFQLFLFGLCFLCSSLPFFPATLRHRSLLVLGSVACVLLSSSIFLSSFFVSCSLWSFLCSAGTLLLGVFATVLTHWIQAVEATGSHWKIGCLQSIGWLHEILDAAQRQANSTCESFFF